jgi:PII-like signaling protein
VLPGVLRRPIANLERIAVVKHDGDLLEPLPMVTDRDDEPPVWMALEVYTHACAHIHGGALYTTLTRQLRRAGGAGITRLFGVWGFSSDERPFGDRIATLASHMPTRTVFVDRPRKIAELCPMVDGITSQHGVVTAAFVPAYRERAAALQHGTLIPEALRRSHASIARHRA